MANRESYRSDVFLVCPTTCKSYSEGALFYSLPLPEESAEPTVEKWMVGFLEGLCEILMAHRYNTALVCGKVVCRNMQGALKIVQPLPCSIKKNRTASSFSDLSLEEEAELGRVLYYSAENERTAPLKLIRFCDFQEGTDKHTLR